VALLAACHGDASPAPEAGVTPQSKIPLGMKRGPSPDELTAGMVEAATIGKSTVPVGVKFDVSARPVVGQPLTIILAVLPKIIADPATLQLAGGEGLTLAGAPVRVEMTEVEPAQVYRQTVSVTPTVAGVQLLELSVSLKHDDMTETRVFAVPLIVAPSVEAVPVANR
jgi:hypothetical protein